MSYKIIPLPGLGITLNRYWIFEYIKGLSKSYIYFCDSDDTLSKNRVEQGMLLLNKNNLVCHDINIIDGQGSVIYNNYWSKRLGTEFSFDVNFLLNKNIVGLGNTSMRSSLLNHLDLREHKDVEIPDWFIFYQILKESGVTALFTSKGKINYRQHENIANLNLLNYNTLRQKVSKVSTHYRCLCDLGYDQFRQVSQDLINMQVESSERFFEIFLERYSLERGYWWEDVNELVKYYKNEVSQR